MAILSMYAYAAPVMVSECSPLPGSEDVPTQSRIMISFSGPLQRESVEKNFFITPEASGEFSWEENKLVFTPQRRLLPGTTYLVSVSPGISDIEGRPIALTYFTTTAHILYTNADDALCSVSRGGEEKFILHPASRQPRWGQANRRILFVKGKDIWMMDYDGQNPRALTREEHNYNQLPQWRLDNDNEYIYAGTTPEKVGNIYLQQINPTGLAKRLTDFSNSGDISQLAFSPDGRYIAFVRENHLWLMDVDGRNKLRLTTEAAECRGSFSFRKDSQAIFFNGKTNIWEISIDRKELRKLSFDDAHTYEVACSSQGKLAYEANGLCVMNEDGSSEQRIYPEGRFIVFSRDGRWLSVTVPLPSDNGRGQLWAMDLSGKEKIKLADISDWRQWVDWTYINSP